MWLSEIEERFERESDWRMAREQVGAKSETKVEEGWPGTTERAFGVSQILLPLFLQFCFFNCCCLFFIAVCEGSRWRTGRWKEGGGNWTGCCDGDDAG